MGSGASTTSQKTKIEFPSDADAKTCHLVVTSGSGNFTISPTTFSSKETLLTITGSNTSQTLISGTVQVVGLSGTSNLPTLTVDVFPVRNVSLGVYYVYDPNSVDTVLPA